MKTQHFIDQYVKLWEECPTDLPEIGKEVSTEEKSKREAVMLEFAKKLKQSKQNTMNASATKYQNPKKFGQAIGHIFMNAFRFSEEEAQIVSKSEFNKVTQQFMQMARSFDPKISLEDIFQASRNLWIINSLQLMMEKPLELSNASFAYSMLYPYTDNYLDNPKIHTSQKHSFSKHFRLRLKGESVIAANKHEKAIFDLVSFIEKDWDRTRYPKVYESLVAIHDAQTASLKLLGNTDIPSDELLEICIEKGGTSVLADGYLVCGEMSPEEENFCYGFGVYLQFVDDIQDLEEDLKGELETFFTASIKNETLDEATNKTLHFTNLVMDKLFCFDNKTAKIMKGLMIKSVVFMTMEAIGVNQHYFSKEYVEIMEKYASFSFEFVNERRSKMSSKRISLMKQMESLISEQPTVSKFSLN